MFFKAALIKISYCFLVIAAALLVVKLVLFVRYTLANKDDLSLNIIWYPKVEIYSTGSSNKRKFMQQMNMITSMILTALAVFVIVFVFRKLLN